MDRSTTRNGDRGGRVAQRQDSRIDRVDEFVVPSEARDGFVSERRRAHDSLEGQPQNPSIYPTRYVRRTPPKAGCDEEQLVPAPLEVTDTDGSDRVPQATGRMVGGIRSPDRCDYHAVRPFSEYPRKYGSDILRITNRVP